MKTFIYSLCDPITEEVRYIGKTDQYLKQRLYSHIQEGRMKTCHGFIWRYKDSWFDLGLDKLDRSTLRAVSQYSKDGILLNEFKSIKEASVTCSVNDGNIGDCCVGRLKSAGGFIWKYK